MEEEAAKARANALNSDASQSKAVFTPPLTPSEGVPPLSLMAAAQPMSSQPDLATQELQQNIEKLQKRYDTTVVELNEVNEKYKASLQEIQDLVQQVEEAQLVRSEGGDTLASQSPSPRGSPVPPPITTDDDEEVSALGPLPSSLTLSSGAGRTPRSRRSLPIASNGRLSFLGSRVANGGPFSASHLRSASLSQELSSAQGLRTSLPPSPRAMSPGHHMSHSRSYESLEKEVKQLQDALESREEEISALENAIDKLGVVQPDESSRSIDDSSHAAAAAEVATPSKPSRAASPVLSPHTLGAFNDLKAELEGDSHDGSMSHDHTVRLEELMRSMARKESAHKELVEDLEDQLASLRKAHDELTTLSRQQVINMSKEIELLRNSLGQGTPNEATEKRLADMQSALASKDEELAAARREAQEGIDRATAKLAAEHETSRSAMEEDHAEAVRRLQDEHASVLRRMLEQREELFTRKMQEYEAALQTQASEHGELLKRKENDHSSALASLQAEMGAMVKRRDDEAEEAEKRFAIERESLVSKEDNSVTIGKLNEEHNSVLQRRQSDFDQAYEKLKADHAAVLKSREDDHAATIARLREEHDTAFMQAIEDHSLTAQNLRQERDAAVKSARSEHEAVVARLKEDHSKALSAISADHEQVFAETRQSHASEVERLKSSHSDALKTADAKHGAALALALAQLDQKKTQEAEQKLAELREEHAAGLQKLASSHDEEMAKLRENHEASIGSLSEGHEAEIRKREAEHAAALGAMLEEHEKAMSNLVRGFPIVCHFSFFFSREPSSAMVNWRKRLLRSARSTPPPYET
jgi:hypothetical protein